MHSLQPSENADITRLKARLVNFSKSFPKESTSYQLNLPPVHFKALVDLKNDKTICICRADKGNSTVILDQSAYLEKMLLILEDQNKFSKDSQKSLKQLRLEVNRCVSKLKTLNVPSSVINRLSPTNCSLPKLYGLPKIHKPNVPLRPILSMTNSPTYNLAKWLANLLKPVQEAVSHYVVKDSFQFVNEVRNLDLSHTVMASLDISSLFTQVPLLETVDMITDLLDLHDIDIGLPTDLLRELILLCTKDVSFSFNNEIYVQHDGVAMGSPLGPCLADIFVGCLERKFHKEISNCCLAYYRFVDDTFAVCEDSDHVRRLHTILNSMHPSLKFTLELEKDDSLPFLDVLVLRDNGVKTKIYRKLTWSGIYLHFDSFVPVSYKAGLVRTLFDRARKICSEEFIQSEFNFLKDTLKKNGYPSAFIDKYCGAPDGKPFGPDRKKVFLELPFCGDKIAAKYNKLLNDTIHDNFSYVQPVIIWKCRRVPQRSLKDSTPDAEKCGNIYNFRCECSSTYIGRTTRTLGERIAEHIPRWLLNGKLKPPRSTTTHSSITQHVASCTYADLAHLHSYFSVMHTNIPDFKSHVLEALLIARHSPDLCKQKNGVYRLLLPW